MPGDFSRKTFNPKKHYSGVLKQQGRVDLDADWNEELDILQHRTHTETRDVIGASGVPKKGDSFKIIPAVDGSNLAISPGHIYVGGLLCESELPANYFNQPYYPNPDITFFDTLPGSPPLSPPVHHLKDGTYIVFADAWQREINYLDDPLIHEVALGEADTAIRLQNVWQVKLLQIAASGANCKTDLAEWNNLITPSTGKLNARTKNVADPANPCVLPPRAGYQRLENQLYRVEVQRGGALANTTFKWSRDNATVETTIESISSNILKVADVGKDEVLGFAGGQWVEIIDESSTLKGTPPQLIQILSVDSSTREITVSTSVFPNANNGKLKLRRWDQSVPIANADGQSANGGWIDLEDGVQVSFSAGTYRPGDYWLISARTATGEIEWPPYEIPNIAPVEQVPLGIKHYYCRLALLKVTSTPSGKTVDVQDCRPLFPSLTEICAEDICFDNTNCEFPTGANNVQEALDLLCAANDLRTHNKYLHGFGVICGLKVKCSSIRTKVVIEKGNALDCEGNMIQVKMPNGVSYELVNEAKNKNLLDDKGNGKLCLSIARGPNKSVAFTVEQFVPQNFWDTVLEGTLLKDFYEDCIKNLIDFFKQQFPFPMTDVAPVPVQQRRLTAMLNLFIQLMNSKTGPYGYISGNAFKEPADAEGEATLSSRPKEDELLRKFYHDLKDKLASETFCAMFDNDHPYPDYILDKGLDTIFGTSLQFHHRLRVSPSGKFAYTCGSINNKVYVYDLGKKEMIQSIDFPTGLNMKLQDIAISAAGDTIFVVGIEDDKNSVFAQGKLLPNGLIIWTNTSRTGFKYISLAVATGNRLFGIARSHGLFEIKGIGTAAFSATVLRAFNATGILHVATDRNQVIAAVDTLHPIGTESTAFTQYIIFSPGQGTGGQVTIPLSGDDLANDVFVFNNTIYATGATAGAGRIIGAFSMNNGSSVRQPPIPIGANSYVRLAVYSGANTGDFLLASLSDELRVIRARLTGEKFEIDGKFRIPVQPFPMALVVDKKTQQGYALNTMVNTLTSMNMAEVFHSSPAPDYTHEPPINLSSYRDDAIEAYKDVLSHLLQYLKDCFCDKFIIDCPECGEDDKVYLGCMEVRNFKVYHICNFSKRKYVKSFRTVEYWLSTVPVLPVVKLAFTKFCCTVFDTGSKNAGKP